MQIIHMVLSKIFPNGGFKQIDPAQFNLKNTPAIVLEVDLEYLKELCELHIDYHLAPDKIEIKRETLSDYQLNIPDFCNIPIGNVNS